MTFGIYAFDAYGTLFDVHAAVREKGQALGDDGPQLSAIWRQKQLEYTWVLTLTDRYEDFWTLTERALDFAFDAVPGADRTVRGDLLEAYRSLSAYPEVGPVLQKLKDRGARLAIFSNGSPAMLESAISSAGIGSLLDEVISVAPLKMFKTRPQTYALVTDCFAAGAGEISFQSSNRWDIAGAAAFGFRTVWINRTNQPDEYPDLRPDLVLSELGGLLEET